MDPNATLADMRAAAEAGDWEAVADHADHLDHWLTGGGFLPDAWTCVHDRRLLPATPR